MINGQFGSLALAELNYAQSLKCRWRINQFFWGYEFWKTSGSLKGNFRSVSLFLASQTLPCPMPAKKYWFWRANVCCLCDWVSLHSVLMRVLPILISMVMLEFISMQCAIQPPICAHVTGSDKKGEPNVKCVCSSSMCLSNMYRERFDRGYRSCEDSVCVCHYLAGTSAYCAHWGWVLLAAQRGEVGGVYQPVWWTTKWIEWRMWWTERERERRRRWSDWLVSEKPTHTHSQNRRRNWSFWWEQKSINRAMKNEVASQFLLFIP